MQTLTGDIDQAMKTIHNYYQVWRQYGSLPEFYNIAKSEVQASRDGYPLRPGHTHTRVLRPRMDQGFGNGFVRESGEQKSPSRPCLDQLLIAIRSLLIVCDHV